MGKIDPTAHDVHHYFITTRISVLSPSSMCFCYNWISWVICVPPADYLTFFTNRLLKHSKRTLNMRWICIIHFFHFFQSLVGWRKLRNIVTWTPFFQTYKNKQVREMSKFIKKGSFITSQHFFCRDIHGCSLQVIKATSKQVPSQELSWRSSHSKKKIVSENSCRMWCDHMFLNSKGLSLETKKNVRLDKPR